MKTKSWVILLALILIACIGLSIPLLLPGRASSGAEILSDGVLLTTGNDNCFHLFHLLYFV